ncbi:MAG: transporter substrate-binding protein [Herbaspirillum sp.]|nr:transporter substrate-binding protein [Herbaspirillum sp.]
METGLNILKLKFLPAILLAACVLPTFAADEQSIAALAAYKGADRQQKLVAAAKKEGSVMLYTSITSEIAQKLSADFEAKYGVKVTVWRADDPTVVQRILTERKSGRNTLDVVNIGSLEMEMLHREKVLQALKSPYTANLVPGAVPPHGEYAATFIDLMLQAYNTNAIKKADLPKTYQDLLNPKWKGQLGLEATDEEWFYDMVESMGEEKGLQYFRDLVAITQPSLRTGHSLLANLVLSGEVPLGLTVYNHSVVTAKKKGAPIDYMLLEPAIAVSFSEGVSNQSQHPNAALLFYEYMLTDGQKVFADLDYLPANKNIDSQFKNVPYHLADQAHFLAQYKKWDDLWNQIIVKRK